MGPEDHCRRRFPPQKGARRTEGQSFGRPQREHHLPWDENSLPLPLRPRLATTGFRRGLVIGKVVVAFFRRSRGTNATARIPNASGCYSAGKRPNANAAGGANRKTAKPMRRLNVNDARSDGNRAALSQVRAGLLPPPLLRGRTRARGHAAPTFLKIFAIVRAVTNHSQGLAAVRLSIVAMVVARLNAGYWTANASSRTASGKPPNAGRTTITRPPDQLNGR